MNAYGDWVYSYTGSFLMIELMYEAKNMWLTIKKRKNRFLVDFQILKGIGTAMEK